MKTVIGLKTFGLLAVAAMGLSACGGSGSTSQADFLERIERFDRQSVRVLGDGEDISGYSNTIADAIPDTGSAQFTGSGTIVAVTGTDDTPSVLAMVGYAEVDVNFAGGTFGGSVKNFQTITISGDDIDAFVAAEDGDELALLGALKPADTSGSITLSGGSIFGNAIDDVTYSGTLRTGGADYEVSGVAGGNFLGTRPADDADPDLFRVKALNIYDEEGTVTVGETAYESGFEIIAESK